MNHGITEKGATERWSDVNMLLPSLRVRVIALVGRLKAMDLEPIVHETFRSQERAEMLARRGTGVKFSMHSLGAAVDIICGKHRWQCHEHGCKFFDHLGEQAEDLSLVWGGRWTRVDKPHCQIVAVKDQERFRKLASQEEREAFISARTRPMT